MELPRTRRPLNRAALLAGVALLLAVVSVADEPYKKMLDDPLAFSGLETLDAATSDSEYRIGVFAPGDHELARGVELAVDQANASGGVKGKRLRVVRRWALDPWGAGSKEVIRMVFEDRVWALIGGPDGATTHVAQQVATKAHLPLVAPVSSDPSLTHTRVPWIFRLPPDDAAQAEALLADGLAPSGLEAVGILVSADHAGRTFAAEIKRAMEGSQMTPVFELVVDPDLPDPGSLADRVKSFAPDGIVMRLQPTVVRKMLAALHAVDVDCAVFVPWIPGLRLGEFQPGYDGPLTEVLPFRPPRQCGPYLKLVRAGVRRHGAKPTASMVYGYDAANLVIEALRQGAVGRVELQRELTELSGYWGASGPIRWDNGGGNRARPVLRIINNN